MNNPVAIVKCASYESALVQEAVRSAVNLAGGICRFVKPNSTVLVKPNLLMALEPRYGVTTHPEVVRAVIKVVKEIQCTVLLGDGPAVCHKESARINEVYERTGMKLIAEEEGVELVEFNKARWRGKFPLVTWLDECDFFISVPKFKTHELMGLTAALKNPFGLLPYTFKKEMHRQHLTESDFARAVVDVYEEARPSLTIVDGIIALEGDGPAAGGVLRPTGLLLAGADGLAIDTVLARIMGVDPSRIPTNKEAAQRRARPETVDSIEIRGERLSDCLGRPFLLPKTSLLMRVPAPIVKIVRPFIRFYPSITDKYCVGCASCVKACPAKTIVLRNGRVSIDYRRCISCFCCQEVCPASAIRIKKSLLAKVYGFLTKDFHSVKPSCRRPERSQNK